MYLKFYGFKKRPFSMTPEPSHLYPGQPHVKAWSVLEYGLSNRSGIMVLAGEVGSGKTTLIKRLSHETRNQLNVGLISSTHKSIRELISWVLIAFDQPVTDKSQAERYQQLLAYLETSYKANRQAVLIVDEAQNLSVDALEELRLLHNLNSENKMLLQLVLVGQPPLIKLLKHRNLSQLVQRISVSYFLKPLNLIETIQYIQHRLTICGGDKNLFTHHAGATVFYYSGGTPRIINALCDLTLAYGFSVEARSIDPGLVLEVVRSKQESGLFPKIKQPSEDAVKARKLIKENTNIDIGILQTEQDQKQSVTPSKQTSH